MSTKAERMAERIKRHGLSLLAVFPAAKAKGPLSLCKKLRRLETQAEAIALRLCNGPEYPGGYDEVNALTDAILAKVRDLLGMTPKSDHFADQYGLFLNCDPRGYALKLSSEWTRAYNQDATLPIHEDCGGYGILAPDLTSD